MEKYHKVGGFFDRLERLSNSIDWFISGVYWDYIEYGILYFVPCFRDIARIRGDIKNSEDCIKYYKSEVNKSIERYNREKYFWMFEK